MAFPTQFVSAIKEYFQNAATQTGLPSAVLAAIASRETHAGSLLDSEGWGDHGNGYGMMQIDKRYNAKSLVGGPYSEEHVHAASKILKRYLGETKKLHPNWSEADQLRGAVSAYNRGTGRGFSKARSPDELDRRTTKHDYSADVWARAQYLAENGF